mgnify:CR=1 FL=1
MSNTTFSPYKNIIQLLMNNYSKNKIAKELLITNQKVGKLSEHLTMFNSLSQISPKGHDVRWLFELPDFGFDKPEDHIVEDAVFVNLITTENYQKWNTYFNSMLSNNSQTFNFEAFGHEGVFLRMINTISILGIKLPLDVDRLKENKFIEYNELIEHLANNTARIYKHLNANNKHPWEAGGYDNYHMPLNAFDGYLLAKLQKISTTPEALTNYLKSGDSLKLK